MKTKKHKTYYKVIRKKSRNSAIITSKKVLVKYSVDEWVRPTLKGTKLMVFETEGQARRWASAMRDTFVQTHELIVVPCHILNARQAYSVATNVNGSKIAERLANFWKHITYCRNRKMENYEIL